MSDPANFPGHKLLQSKGWEWCVMSFDRNGLEIHWDGNDLGWTLHGNHKGQSVSYGPNFHLPHMADIRGINDKGEFYV